MRIQAGCLSMFNLPVKLSVLSMPYFPLSPQVFLDKTPEECLRVFKEILPEKLRYVLDFAFPSRGILLLLEKEFEVRVIRQEMLFTKPHLDSESWLFANGFRKSPAVEPAVEGILQGIAEDLWEQVSALSPVCTHPIDKSGLLEELRILLSLYYSRYGSQNPRSLDWLQTFRGIGQFLNLVVAEAIYKADGAKVLFGREAVYPGLWIDKQWQFYSYVQHFQQIHLKRPA